MSKGELVGNLIRSRLLEYIYREQKCILCNHSFNVVGVLGDDRVKNSDCRLHPRFTDTGIMPYNIKVHSSEREGSCIVCNNDRIDKFRCWIVEYEKFYNVQGCTKIGHIGEPWSLLSGNLDLTRLKADSQKKLEESIMNMPIGPMNSFKMNQNGSPTINVKKTLMDVSSGLYVLPLYLFRNIMEKQKKYSDSKRNWYPSNIYNIPYEEGDVSSVRDYLPFTEKNLDEIYNHFCNQDRNSLKINGRYDFSSTNFNGAKMLIFENPARFVSEFIKIQGITSENKLVSSIADTSNNLVQVSNINVKSPYVRVRSGALDIKVPLLDAYNSMLSSFGLDTFLVPESYLESKIEDGQYIKHLKYLLNASGVRVAVPLYRTPTTTISTTSSLIRPIVIDTDQPQSSASYNSTKGKKKREIVDEPSNDEDDNTSSNSRKRARIETPVVFTKRLSTSKSLNLENPELNEGILGHDEPASILSSYQSKQEVIEKLSHVNFYEPLPHRSTIEVKRALRPSSYPTTHSIDMPMNEALRYHVNGSTITEFQNLQYQITNMGKVNPLHPAIGIYPNGNVESNAIPGIKNPNGLPEDRVQQSITKTFTPAMMQTPISRTELSSLNAASSSKYATFINAMRQHIQNQKIGTEMMQQFEMAMQASFDNSSVPQTGRSIFKPWVGIERRYIDAGFLPFAILLNADYVII